MMRRSVQRVAVAATGAFLLWGGTRLHAAEAASAALPFPAAKVVAPATPIATAQAPQIVVGTGIGTGITPPIGVEYGAVTPTEALGGGDAMTATAGDGVATIPLPPSTYPGMVGLATAALSVWRYRRRRR
jgi:hypothetical protein